MLVKIKIVCSLIIILSAIIFGPEASLFFGGANAVHQMSNTPGFNNAPTQAISAQQFINTSGIATGLSFIANVDKGFINVTRFNQIGIVGTPASTSSGANSASLNSTYIRAARFFDLKKWDQVETQIPQSLSSVYRLKVVV